MLEQLPPEVIADILSRLPVKPLLQYRCVSKPWCSLIDSTRFIETHLNRSIQTRTNLTLIYTVDPPNQRTLYSLEFDSLNSSSLHLNDDVTNIWGSCNGLVCLSIADIDVALWNPSTRKLRKLPTSIIHFPHPKLVFGFGFDPRSDDYKVVRISQFQDVNSRNIYSVVEVCGLKSDSWRRVEELPHDVVLPIEPGFLASGGLHWHATKKPVRDGDDWGCILGFNIEEERYRIVPKPDPKPGYWSSMGVLEGCLCAIYQSYFLDDVADIWLMKEYGVKESWTKLITIQSSILFKCYHDLRPVAYSKDSGKVLLEHTPVCGLFLWYDLEGKTIKTVTVRDKPSQFAKCTFFGSLVPLHGIGSGSDGSKEANTRRTEEKDQ